MQANEYLCPHCMVVAPLSMFENVGDGNMRCRRCRSQFKDPNAYAHDVTYADCDSKRPVTRYPFSLSGNRVTICVRKGYLALLEGSGGRRQWIRSDCSFDGLEDFRLYYICLTPQVSWGVGSVDEFGVYGYAQLSLTEEYVKRFFTMDRPAMELEAKLKQDLIDYIAHAIRQDAHNHNVGRWENQDVYRNLGGMLEDGVSAVRIIPMGFRNAAGEYGTFPWLALFPEERADQMPALPRFIPPVEIINPPGNSYVVAEGVEEVFVFRVIPSPRIERHKSGERIDIEQLRSMKKLVRYKSKEFEYPFGWGIFNQPQVGLGFYSAQGTLSFYIDSTEQFSRLLYQSGNWQEFEKQFYVNILAKAISDDLGKLIGSLAGSQRFEAEAVNDYLGALSIRLTDALNGETAGSKEPAFRQYGLRVKQTDILSINFYSDRR